MQVTNGQTLGKRLLKIRVVRTDGNPMSALRAVWRQVALLIVLCNVVAHADRHLSTLLFLVFVLDFAWPLWNANNRALHDFAAGTRVVRRPPPT